mgnify:CR=1 FL=1
MGVQISTVTIQPLSEVDLSYIASRHLACLYSCSILQDDVFLTRRVPIAFYYACPWGYC